MPQPVGVKGEVLSRTCSHCALGRKDASNRPKFFAPSMARLPVPDLVAHLEEQRAFPAPAVGHADAVDERLLRRRIGARRSSGTAQAV